MERFMKTALLLVGSTALAMAADTAMACAAMKERTFGKEVRIESATAVAGSEKLPAHCDVRGVIWPEAKFVIKLPAAWNERFQMVGNGGTAGVLSMGAVDRALRNGFAAASTDTGHDAAKEPLATFAYVTPENPNGRRKLIDFAYLSVHETAVLAKRVIQSYYGKAAKYSYWVGCSTGGRQGMQEAQRYPEDFDGLVIGAPALFLTGNVMRRIWVGQGQIGDAALPVEKLALLNRLVYEKCDASDGLADGVIDDPRRCDFRAARDLPKCSGAGQADCFTAAQIGGIARIYGGVKTSKGKLLFPGEPLGSESVWAENLVGPSKLVLPRAESQMKFYILTPPPGPAWSYRMFDFDKDPARTAAAAKWMNPLSPDLGPLKRRGGKILQYSGWADQQVNPLPGISYYESVRKRMGEGATGDFYRLFMVPGMFHCGGGPGCGNVDWMGALMEWVEKGVAPARIVGSHVEKGKTTRTRPVCPYPQVARYKGTGSQDDAANFACVVI
jgi:feruloyl esterase